MRKRIWAVLLTICMLVGLLPTTALAGGVGMDVAYSTYEASKEAAAVSTTSPLHLSDCNFDWPTEEDTLTIKRPILIDTGDSWEIPANIHLVFSDSGRIYSVGGADVSLTINGTVTCPSYSFMPTFQLLSSEGTDNALIIGPKAKIEGGFYIDDNITCIVKSGAEVSLDSTVMLGGTLKGEGAKVGTVRANNGYHTFNGERGTAVLDGTLTVEKMEIYSSVSSSESEKPVYDLIIPSGSQITMGDGASLDIPEGSQLSLEGGLTIGGGYGNSVAGTIAIGESGTLTLPQDSALFGGYVYNSETQKSEEVYGQITGNGTIKAYATKNDNVINGVPCIWEIPVPEIVGDRASYADLVAESVTIWCSWTCDHQWDDGVVTTEPTCTQPGVKTYTCTQCQSTRTEEIEATGHTAVTDAAVDATCTTDGKTEGSHCSVCNEVLVAQEVIPALGHAWSTNNCAEAATCTREGCGATRAAGEHIWGGWTVTKEATCTAEGSRTHTCTSCNTSESETITKLGHSYSSVVTAPTCTEQGYTTHTCARCGDSYVDTYVNAKGHAWDDGVITTPPTLDADGVKTFTCSSCGETKTETIPKLAQQEVSWTPAGPVTVTYGAFSYVQPTAYNESVEDCRFSYSSSDPSVATVDANGKTSIVGAGTTVITATAPAVPGQYAETSASYTLVVNKAKLTVTANNHTITYGQAPTYNGYTVTGLVNGDSESVLTGAATYACGYEQYGKAESYDITLSGLSAKNYDIIFEKGTLTVEKAKNYTITLGKLEQVAGYTSAVSANVEPYDATAKIKVEYQFNNQWTEIVPAEAGKYDVRARLIASENIELDDDVYTDGTLVVKNGITVDPGQGVDDVEINVNVTDNKASLVVADVNQITDKANGDVKINIGGVSGAKELELPGDLMTGLSQNEKADSLTVTTEDASISMSSAVLDTVASAITDGGDTVAVKLTAVEKTDLNQKQQDALDAIAQDAVIVEVSLIITHADNSSTELHELGGEVEITVPYAGPVPDGKYIVVSYVSNDGGVSYVRATYNEETKQVSFSTNHFSNYALFLSGQNTYDVSIEGGNGSGTYLEGSTVTIKADSKSGYTFAEWEIVSGDVTLADAKTAETTFTMPAANVELTATYTKNSSGSGGVVSTFTLTFDTNGGSAIASVSKASGTAIDLTGYVPTREGYDFGGWYADAKLTDKITSVNLTKNMTVYAKWTEKDGENPFTDVSGDAYYADAVIWAVGEGITSGTTATTFAPDNPCTRAQAVTFLWRAAGSPVVNYAMNFSDVSADAYYAEAVRWAVSQAITMGTSDTAFSPNAPCTRAQIVTFLWRSQQSPAADGVNPFSDVAADAYYASAVLWAAENGITSGTTATTFSPDATCTRAQIVTFLYRAFAD